MSHPDTLNLNTAGLTVYAIASTQASFLVGNVIMGSDAEIPKRYVFTGLDDATHYEVRERIGASPASTDPVRGYLPIPTASAAVGSAIKTVSDKLATMLTADGENWTFTVAALANAPAGGGGGEVDEAAIAALVLAGLTSINVTHSRPTYDPTSHTLTLFQSDTYSTDILRVHSWDVTDQVEALPSGKRTGLTWKFRATRIGKPPIEATGDVTEVDEEYSIPLELAKSKIAENPGNWQFAVKLVTAVGEEITIDYGPMVLIST